MFALKGMFLCECNTNEATRLERLASRTKLTDRHDKT